MSDPTHINARVSAEATAKLALVRVAMASRARRFGLPSGDVDTVEAIEYALLSASPEVAADLFERKLKAEEAKARAKK
jgi:hypothetical protein